MVGSLILAAAALASGQPALQQTAQGAAGHRPASTASAEATVTIRIVSGVRFGPDAAAGAETAAPRAAEIRDPDGVTRPAKLLEFQ